MSTPNEALFDINLPDVLRSSGKLTNSAIHDLIRGKNWVGGPTPVTPISDNPGLVFLTKPDLKLTDNNIGNIRMFSPLTTRHPRSIASAIRDSLDPRTARSLGGRRSELNDPKNPFFSILDNTLLTLDGWPDYVLETFVSNPGNMGSTWAAAKGTHKPGQHFNLTATHQNVRGDVINQIYTYWALWTFLVTNNDVVPHKINVLNDRYDYFSRWYRFIFDETGRRVNQFTMCGASFPTASSQGAVMNYDVSQSRNTGYETVSASWACTGVYHNDPIVIDEFNRTVYNANRDMQDHLRDSTMVKVENNLQAYRGYGYPRIDPRTLEFEVWVPKPFYAALSSFDGGAEVLARIERKFQDDYARAQGDLTPEERAAIFA